MFDIALSTLVKGRFAKLAFWDCWPSSASNLIEGTCVIRLYHMLLITAATTAFMLAMIPVPPTIPLVSSDYGLHALVFAILSALGALAFPQTLRFRLWAALAIFGGLIELCQALPLIHRDADWLDWLVDAAAAALVLMLFPLRRPKVR